MTRSRPPFRITIGRDAERPASFSGGCGISGSSCTTQTHHRRRRDDDDPKKIFRFACDRACWPAGAAIGRWVWRGRGARRGSCRVRVVCRAERRRDKLKRKRRSGVMVCVSVFVTHQARGTGSIFSCSMVVCRAERRRDKFKRKRRSGVMVCVSVFVTHQEARDDF